MLGLHLSFISLEIIQGSNHDAKEEGGEQPRRMLTPHRVAYRARCHPHWQFLTSSVIILEDLVHDIFPEGWGWQGKVEF